MIQQRVHEGAEAGKTMLDFIAGGVGVAAVAQWLPPVAAGFTIIWLAIRIYEWARWVRSGRKGHEGE